MRRYIVSMIAIAALSLEAGCGTRQIIRGSLAANDPGRLDAPTGPPPVPPETLAIAPTDESPTSTPAISPEPILPKMDEDFRVRRFPQGVGPTLPPATRPSDLRNTPYSNPGLGTGMIMPDERSQP